MPYVGVLGKGATLTIVVSSANQYPTSRIVSPDIYHLKDFPCLDFLGKLSRGVPTMSQMCWDSLFPCPSP